MDQESTPITRERQRASLGIPVAIVIGAALIAGAVYMSGLKAPENQQAALGTTEAVAIAPVTSADHIRGNPNAPIIIVEYSDYDCPFCKLFHDTMKQVMATYGTDGTVAWVYRQLPIEGLHPNAPKIAEASECVAELGGNEAFWTFTDLVFGERQMITTEQGQTVAFTDMSKLPEYAASAGVDRGAFESCLTSGKYTSAIADAVAAGSKAGAKGTPHSIVLVGTEQLPLSGYVPYEDLKTNIDTWIATMRSQNSGT